MSATTRRRADLQVIRVATARGGRWLMMVVEEQERINLQTKSRVGHRVMGRGQDT